VNELATVELKPGESQERLLKRFRKKVQRERILSTVRRKRFFVSKSEQKRIALRKARRRERRRQWRTQKRYRRYA
jgi:small subunit ribosomal protein S21